MIMARRKLGIIDSMMELVKASNRYIAIPMEHGGPSEPEAKIVVRAIQKLVLTYAESGYKFKSRDVETPFGKRTLLWPLGVDDTPAGS